MLIIIALIIIIFLFSRTQKGGKERSPTPKGNDANAVIEEAVTVINDFLNAGSVAQVFSSETDFRGLVIYTPDSRGHSNYGVYILMNDVCDLRNKDRAYPKMISNNPGFAAEYYEFMDKYGNCYSASDRGYVYRTRNTVSLSRGQEKQLKAKLTEEIVKRCPLADLSGSLLYTKNVYRG